MTENDTYTDDTEREWKFQDGDVIREIHEQFTPGGVPIGKSEYRIKRLLRQESDGERFYHVQTEMGHTHLYAASAIEHSYETITTDESGFVFVDTGTDQ